MRLDSRRTNPAGPDMRPILPRILRRVLRRTLRRFPRRMIRQLLRGLPVALILVVGLSACGGSNQSGQITTTPPLSPTQMPSVDTSAVSASATSAPPIAGSTQTSTEVSQPQPTLAATDSAQSVTRLPAAGSFSWQPVVSGLTRPLELTHAGDGSGRLFVLEQPGVIRILRDDQLLATPFLDIHERVGSNGNEQGLLGIAFHPNYTQNGFFYLDYTDRDGNTNIARYSVSANDPDQADPNSEMLLLRVEQPYENHNGGQLAFGPDGFLYIGLGDGGSANDPAGNGQSTNALLGKILRIDVDHGDRYAIPADNPFANGGGLPEIWMIGLRNPWRFSFDRLTSDLYIGDVGQNTWEEIDYWPAGAPGGANFGWNYREGAHPFKGTPPADANLIDPVAEYQHPVGCSVTGGYVYRGARVPALQGVYLYSDFCSGKIWGLLHLPDGSWQNEVLLESGANVTAFGQDEAGEVYLINQADGSVNRISPE